jgi:O-succinylhomoserine sulfhydrylase
MPDHSIPARRPALATRLVRAGTTRSPHGETAEAIWLTQGFVYDSAAAAEARFDGSAPGFVYSRYGNPTVAMFEARMAAVEGAEACIATASGMAAVFASLACQVRSGDRIVAGRALFGSCHHILTQILPRWGVECVLVDGRDLDAWAAALDRPTKVVFFESPTNPNLELVDIAAVARLAHAAGARVVIDNVFATPLLQRPLELGCDIVVYSATKHIDGQGRCLGGAVLADAKFINEQLMPFYRHTGPALSPFNAWVLLKGLETLDLRVDRSCRTAARLADQLAEHPKVARVLYPHRADHPQAELARRQMSAGGTLVSFDVVGGKTGAFAFLDALATIDISNNLGDAKSLVTHPWTTTHRAIPEAERRAAGIGEGSVRLSVGLEDADDLASDVAQALDRVG